jgi:hypothetical protein
MEAEGEGFEPSTELTPSNGFRDRRTRRQNRLNHAVAGHSVGSASNRTPKGTWRLGVTSPKPKPLANSPRKLSGGENYRISSRMEMISTIRFIVPGVIDPSAPSSRRRFREIVRS